MQIAAIGDGIDVGGLAASRTSPGLFTGNSIGDVLGLDAIFQHLYGLRADLADPAFGYVEETSQVLTCLPFEEVADDHETLALWQQRYRITEVGVEFAGLEFF